jgi:acyl-CoA synthetase (NDP forming)
VGRTRHPLAPLLDPEGVAVIGASEAPGKYGHILLRTLIQQGYRGAIHAVNPRGGSLLGLPFLRSLEEVQGTLDVALVVRPAEECPGIVRELARRGVPFAIVYAAGFAETGPEGEELQRTLVLAARSGPTRLVGPNGMNVFSAPARLNLSGIVPFPEGGLAFLSASGNLGYAFAQEAANKGRVGFSRFVSVGNQADLALDEYLDFLREDPATRAVLVYLEGFVKGRAPAFLDVLARTAAEKPVLVLRGGRTKTGQRTARSHTAALTPGPLALRAALEQAGAVLVDRADEALAVAEAFLASPLPHGGRTVLVGEGGGHATLASDTAAETGLGLPSLPDSLLAEIRPHLPAYAAIVRNPVEVGGVTETDPRIYEKVLAPLFSWPECDQIVLFGGYALYDARTAAFLDERRTTTGKPVLLHDLYADEDRPAFEKLAERRLPVYASADVAVRAAAALARGSRARSRAAEAAALAAPGSLDETPALPVGLVELVEQGRTSPERALTEDGAMRLVAFFGVPTLPSELAGSADDAVRAAGRLGYPVVLKVHNAAVLHKTDSEGVWLDLRRPEEVREAFTAIVARHPEVTPGVRVTPFRGGGLEVLIGARRDPELGPLLLVGAGGIMAEAMGAVAIRRLPCSGNERRGMLQESGLSRLLDRARGGPAPDREGILGALDALSRLVAAVPAVVEVEVNPLRCAADGCVALDARVIFAA